MCCAVAVCYCGVSQQVCTNHEAPCEVVDSVHYYRSYFVCINSLIIFIPFNGPIFLRVLGFNWDASEAHLTWSSW